MTVQGRNEAAERLLGAVYLRTPAYGKALTLIEEALAAERRATVERIRRNAAALSHHSIKFRDLEAILDEVAATTGRGPAINAAAFEEWQQKRLDEEAAR